MFLVVEHCYYKNASDHLKKYIPLEYVWCVHICVCIPVSEYIFKNGSPCVAWCHVIHIKFK